MVKNIGQVRKIKIQSEDKTNKRSWPVTVLALFLAVQGIAFIALATYHITLVDIALIFTPIDLLIKHPDELKGIAYYGLGVMSLVASVGFFQLWLFSWMLAIITQFITLAVAITLYFQGKPIYIFPMMFYGIIMVIYLNYSDVINTFRIRPITEEWGGIDEE